MNKVDGIDDDHHWTQGDVVIISSDRVRFHTSSALLSWASSVFDDMLALPSGGHRTKPVLELSDTQFEDAQTLRSFLCLISDMKLDFAISCDHKKREYMEWKDRVINLVTFMDKYSSERAFKLLKLWSNHAEVSESWSEHSAFVFGALTNNIEMCAKAIMLSSTVGWLADNSSPIGARPKAVFQLSAAPYDFFCAIPPQYAYALARAGLAATPGTEAFRDEFVNTVTAALKAKGSEHSTTPGQFAAHTYSAWGGAA